MIIFVFIPLYSSFPNFSIYITFILYFTNITFITLLIFFLRNSFHFHSKPGLPIPLFLRLISFLFFLLFYGLLFYFSLLFLHNFPLCPCFSSSSVLFTAPISSSICPISPYIAHCTIYIRTPVRPSSFCLPL